MPCRALLCTEYSAVGILRTKKKTAPKVFMGRSWDLEFIPVSPVHRGLWSVLANLKTAQVGG